MMKPHERVKLYTETEEGATIVLSAARARLYQGRFKTMFEASTMTIAMMDRPPVYYRAMLWLAAVLDPVQWRKISAREVARETGISISSAERALTMLEKDRVILTDGRTFAKVRRLNNNLFWASSSEKWNRAERDPEVIDARGR